MRGPLRLKDHWVPVLCTRHKYLEQDRHPPRRTMSISVPWGTLPTLDTVEGFVILLYLQDEDENTETAHTANTAMDSARHPHLSTRRSRGRRFIFLSRILGTRRWCCR